MLGIGLFELIVIVIVAVVVFNPKELPRLAYICANFLQRLQAFSFGLKQNLENNWEQYHNKKEDNQQ